MSLTRKEIAEKLTEILRTADSGNAALSRTLREEDDLYTDLSLTSVGMLYLVIAVEESFGIRFDDVGMNDFTVVRDVIDYIERKLS